MRRTLIIFLFAFANMFLICLNAQSYTPDPGSVIRFYPVSDFYKNCLLGYDCFFTPNAYKNGKVKISPKYRFMQEKGVTPFVEIENHTFTIISSSVENEYSKVDKRAFLCFLKRDDGQEIILRVPFVRNKKDNKLTQNMSITTMGHWGYIRGLKGLNFNISIPCCLEKDFSYMKGKFEGKDILYHINSDRNYEEEKEYSKILIANSKEIQKPYDEKIYSKYAPPTLHCDSIIFLDIPNYAYKQPVAALGYKGNSIYVPLFDFRSSGAALYGQHYSFYEYFEDINILFEEEYEKLSDSIQDLLGKWIVYDKTWNDVDKYMYRDTYNIQTKQQYKFEKNERYYVERVDLSKINGYPCFPLQAIMHDEHNNRIQIPVSYLKPNEYGYYGGLFTKEETILQRKAKEAEQDSIYQSNYVKYSKKYGQKGARVIAKGYCSEDDYAHWKKQYGERTAVMIAEGLYDVGFPKSAFYVAINKDYIKLIASYNDQTGSYEVIQHREFNPKYVTFRNGKIISITDFY